MKKKKKLEYGYLKYKRTLQTLLAALGVCLVAGFYITGMILFDGKTNILTFAAILIALPTAKAVVGLYILLPHRALSAESYEETAEIPGMLYDIVLASEESIRFLPALYLRNNVLYFYANGKQVDVGALETYLDSVFKKNEIDHVTVIKGHTEWNSFVRMVRADQSAHTGEEAMNDGETVRHILSVYCV